MSRYGRGRPPGTIVRRGAPEIPAVSGDGVGDTLSEGVGAVQNHEEWPFDYVTLVVSVTGVGDTLSQGVGGAAQAWPFDYWDGSITGVGDTLSQGVGAVSVLAAPVLYTITGTITGAAAGAGAGDNVSEGVGTVGTYDSIVPVTGVGETLSGDGSIHLGTVLPPGGIRLAPYWEPGEYVYCYLLWQWLGSYEAKLNAGHGPLVTTGVADPDATVVLTGLAPGEYVAVDGRKRVHFVITP